MGHSLQSRCMARSDDVRARFDVDQFAHTVVRFDSGQGWIDIVPQAVSAGEGSTDEQSVITESVYVISGCNPGFREADDVNERRHGLLEARLNELGVTPRPAVGLSPDESWIEPSWAVVGLTRDQACDVGWEFGQVAVFEIDSRQIHVVRCVDRTVTSSSSFRVVMGPSALHD